VNGINAQIDQEVERENLIGTAQALLAVMPDNAIVSLTNISSQTASLNAWGNITDASWATDREGNKGLRYTYSYGTPGAEEEGDLHEAYNQFDVVSGVIKYDTYGLFGGGGEAEAGEGGEGESGWEIAGKITEATAITLETTKEVVIGSQKLANVVSGSNYEILNGGKLVEGAGKSLAITGAVLTTLNGITNGWQNHHTADLSVDAAIYIISAEVPIAGWIMGGGYFIGNLIFEHYHNGQSITEYYLDK
jgi:hypothetical protein